ncbi:GH36 C-terminal domain-containing protein, partial [Pedobacter sp.]|uniref:GH36 C-terminal domain-containing protein n=1 Tax=Pedobacter sp. TaxID=1411316 RepID=UPI002C051006
IVVSKLSENDLKFCKDAIQVYNGLKPTIWQGNQYRLANPREGSVASMLYLSDDLSKGVVFNYLVSSRYDEGSKLPVRLKGLDPARKYRLKEVNLYPGASSALSGEQVYSGDFLMKVGFNPLLDLNRTSVVVQIEAL